MTIGYSWSSSLFKPQRPCCGLSRRFRPEWVIDPSSNAYYRWLAILSIAIVYNTVIVVPRAVFDELQEGDYVIAWFVLDYISDAMYVADMIIHVITGTFKRSLILLDYGYPTFLWYPPRPS